MEASVLCDINKLREYNYALNTALEGLAWYTKARDNKELNESDSYCIPSYCFNWNDGAEMDAPHKQSGSPDNPDNFNNHKSASKDAVNGRIIAIYDENKISEMYKPYKDYLMNNKDKFNADLFIKYVRF